MNYVNKDTEKGQEDTTTTTTTTTASKWKIVSMAIVVVIIIISGYAATFHLLKKPECLDEESMQAFKANIDFLSSNNEDEVILQIYLDNIQYQNAKEYTESKCNIERMAQAYIGSFDIFDAVNNCDLLRVKIMIIIKKVDLETKNCHGNTILCNAAYYGDIDVVEFLLKYGCKVDLTGANGITPLSVAAIAGNSHIAEFLIEKGANKDSQDDSGNTPLYWAVRSE